MTQYMLGWGDLGSDGTPQYEPARATRSGLFAYIWSPYSTLAFGFDDAYGLPPEGGPFQFTIKFTPTDGGPVLTQSVVGSSYLLMEHIFLPNPDPVWEDVIVPGVYEITCDGVSGGDVLNKLVLVAVDGMPYGTCSFYADPSSLEPVDAAFWTSFVHTRELSE